MEMIVEYKDEFGFYIVRLSNGRYYYGDGKTINSFGISANQFLRFHPYMEYVGDKITLPSENVTEWITQNT